MNENRILSALIGFLFLAAPATALADANGNIQKLTIAPSGTVISVTLVGLTPLCATVVRGNTSTGDLRAGNGGVTADGLKNILSALMAAKLSGAIVTVFASNGTSSSVGCILTGVSLN
jgi:hypothetical protein